MQVFIEVVYKKNIIIKMKLKSIENSLKKLR